MGAREPDSPVTGPHRQGSHLAACRKYTRKEERPGRAATRPETLHFLDPPYWQTEGYGHDFDLAAYGRLADSMRQAKGRAILTINDHPEVQTIFQDFRCHEVPLRHTVGGKGGVPRREQIYLNWA